MAFFTQDTKIISGQQIKHVKNLSLRGSRLAGRRGNPLRIWVEIATLPSLARDDTSIIS